MRKLFAALLFTASIGLAQTKTDAPSQISRGTYIDIRDPRFGAKGITGNCHISTIDNQPQIQAALNYAAANGPLDVYLPGGFCWPLGSHIWIPPGVHFFSRGRTSGYETSSPGGLLIANSNWHLANTSFPYSQMVWVTGDNYSSGTYIPTKVTFGTEVDHMEINCNDELNCGNMLAVGRQEKSSIHDVIMTGGVFVAATTYGYGFYEQGVDCNGAGLKEHGCLLPTGTTQQFSGQQGEDYNIEIFPSYNAPSANFIPWVMMGANNYKGLKNSTLNCNNAGSTAGAYFWGDNTTIGPGLHIEGCGSNNDFVIGSVPEGTGQCIGGNGDLFTVSDPRFVISSCNAQNDLTFLSVTGGVLNNAPGAPDVAIDKSGFGSNYYWDSTTKSAGPPGVKYGYYSPKNIVLTDPGAYFQVGYGHYSAYNGTPSSGWNAGQANETAALSLRGYTCANAYWNHPIGAWSLGGDGGSDYSCMLNLNGGAIGFSAIQTVGAGGFTNPTMLSGISLVVSGAQHVLVGPGWISGTTGAPTGEGSSSLQVRGGQTVDNLTVTGTLTYPGSGTNYGFFPGMPPTSIPAQGGYIGWNAISFGETDFINQKGLGSGGFRWYNSSGTSPGTVLMNLDSTGLLSVGSIAAGASITGSSLSVTGTASGVNVTAGALMTSPKATFGVHTSSSTGNNDNFGQLTFSSSDTSSTYTFTGSYSAQPICTVSLDAGAINGYLSPVLATSGGHWTITIKSNTSLGSGNGNYNCGLRP